MTFWWAVRIAAAILTVPVVWESNLGWGSSLFVTLVLIQYAFWDGETR